ncbi:MAG: hypothetical protein P8X96_22065 [Desulfobacteraceae bacterium]|jgi:hypothetical protein
MNLPQRPLGTVVEILQLMGLDVTHQYEDLVFVSHSLFILKFTDDPAHIDLYFNEEIEEEKAQELMGQLDALGTLHSLTIEYKGAYALSENSDESLSVEFFDLTDPG